MRWQLPLWQKTATDRNGPDGLDEDSFQREDEIIRLTDKDIRDGILYFRLLSGNLYMP